MIAYGGLWFDVFSLRLGVLLSGGTKAKRQKGKSVCDHHPRYRHCEEVRQSNLFATKNKNLILIIKCNYIPQGFAGIFLLS